MVVLEQRRLLHSGVGHNKEYTVELIQYTSNEHRPAGAGRFEVLGRYGRIGGNLNEAIKFRGLEEHTARSEFQRIVNEKLNKGYTQAVTFAAPVDRVGSVRFVERPVEVPNAPKRTRTRKAKVPSGGFPLEEERKIFI